MWELRTYDLRNFFEGDFHLMELVGEVEEELGFENIYEIDDKTYRICASSPVNKVLGVEEVTLVNEPEDQEGEEFTCPYCLNVNLDAFELQDNGTKECGHCGSEVEFERHYEITYSVMPVKQNKIVKL